MDLLELLRIVAWGRDAYVEWRVLLDCLPCCTLLNAEAQFGEGFVDYGKLSLDQFVLPLPGWAAKGGLRCVWCLRRILNSPAVTASAREQRRHC